MPFIAAAAAWLLDALAARVRIEPPELLTDDPPDPPRCGECGGELDSEAFFWCDEDCHANWLRHRIGERPLKPPLRVRARPGAASISDSDKETTWASTRR